MSALRILGTMLLLAPLASCTQALLATQASVLPLVPVFAPAPFQPDVQADVRVVRTSADDVRGGTQAELHVMALGGQPVGLAGWTHLQLGTFGEDRWTGFVDSELGVGVGRPGFHVGLLAGLAYGGFLRSAQSFPLRLVAAVDVEQVAVRLSGYAGWRLDDEDAPAGTRSLGPWDTWGGSLDLTILRIGPSLGLSWDVQDDLTFFGMHVGIGGHAPL